MDPLLETISAEKDGFKWDSSGLQLESLCYADDNALLTEDPAEMQGNLNIVEEFCQTTGMRLNVKKSAGFNIKPGSKNSYVINDFKPKWVVDNQKLPLVNPSEGNKYLGVKVSSWTGCIKKDLLTKLETWCDRIGKSILKPRQKLAILQSYALARVAYHLSQVDHPKQN
ncbi:unnamed protein product [Mytilus coruscus]|uniref:Reverse transcriptase domain-containing protein n=1 Tax=Mytilus coruscus TaxID=42192 RepID=A0A6J8BKY1_MYTCO|nr:unnamed protein product [Mytilus coruscus]